VGKFALLRSLSEFRLKSSVVLMIGNSTSNHFGAQGTLNPTVANRDVYIQTDWAGDAATRVAAAYPSGGSACDRGLGINPTFLN